MTFTQRSQRNTSGATMRLSYSPHTGHVKDNGAVIGLISVHGTRVVYRHFQLKELLVYAATLQELLPKIRLLLEGTS